MSDSNKIFCSFCGATQSEGLNSKMPIIGSSMIATHRAYICVSCINMCNNMINNVTHSELDSVDFQGLQKYPVNQSHVEMDYKMTNPSAIKKSLDDYVVGQDRAKIVLSVAIYNHLKRISDIRNNKNDDVIIDKSNILLIGPTGSGKTLLARRIAKELSLPFCIVDATTFTEAGYVGNDVESILMMLLQDAGNDLSSAECGVVYIDEIDKISKKTDNHSRIRDISGEGVQEALLKIIEGTDVYFNQNDAMKDKNTGARISKMNTSNILFIFGGSFSALDRIIEKRKNFSRIGFNNTSTETIKHKDSNILQSVEVDDLIKFGMIPEFVSRCPVMVVLDPLSVDQLKSVLIDTKNSIFKQYKKLFAMDGIELDITDCAYYEIAHIAKNCGLGARSLRRITEDIFMDTMFNIPTNQSLDIKLFLDKDAVINKKPIIQKK